MIENYGSGIGRMFDACKEAGLPEPDFANFSGGFRILFTPQGKSAQLGSESGAESAAIKILMILRHTPMGKSEIVSSLKLNTVTGALNRSVRELLDDELIEYTVPEKMRAHYVIPECKGLWHYV